MGLDTCTSRWYCPPSTIMATHREMRGHKYSYVELYELFPFLEPLYASFEKGFDIRPWFMFVHETWWLPIASIVLYMAMIVVLPRVFKDRPVKLGKTLAYWNLFLAAFSIMGTIRTVPHLLWFMSTHTFKETVCTQPQLVNGDGASGLWCLLFTLSKVAELADTLFICLKGRKPIFLHWYHHVTVLCFTWAAYAARHPGLHFIAMNYTVHAVMYSYFFLMAIDAKPKWLNPMYITFLQISQMIAGVAITVCGFIYSRDPECAVVPNVLYVQGVIYGSYLYLFLEFLVKRFFAKGKGASTGGSKSKAAAAAAGAGEKQLAAAANGNGNGHAAASLKKSQ